MTAVGGARRLVVIGRKGWSRGAAGGGDGMCGGEVSVVVPISVPVSVSVSVPISVFAVVARALWVFGPARLAVGDIVHHRQTGDI